MSYEQILSDVADSVATITLNRPDRLNAVTARSIDELIAAFDAADADDGVRAVIVTGAGRAFCAGADLGAGGRTFDRADRSTADEHRDGGGRVTLRIFDLKKPVIAAINGPAVGFGITLTLPMDVRIASTAARIGFVFARRGVVPEACSTWFLPRLVGMSQAAEWALTGRVFSAEEALAGRRHAAVLSLVAVIDWALGALVITAASFVQGLAGFGIGLVGLAFLPYLMSPATAIVLLTLYAAPFTLGVFIQLRDDFRLSGIRDMLVGTVLGTPIGVWGLAALPASLINRLIGVFILLIVILEVRRLFPERLPGRGWGVGAGVLSGVLGGAIGTPAPPVIVYSMTQGWTPRRMKANLQAFMVVNQTLILGGYEWAGLLTREVWHLGLSFAIPALVGVLAGIALFGRIDAVRFRQIVFTLLFISGLVLLLRG